jgi:hypothetical protein
VDRVVCLLNFLPIELRRCGAFYWKRCPWTVRNIGVKRIAKSWSVGKLWITAPLGGGALGSRPCGDDEEGESIIERIVGELRTQSRYCLEFFQCRTFAISSNGRHRLN